MMKAHITYVFTLTLLMSVTAAKANSCLDSCDIDQKSRSHLAIKSHFQSASPEMVSAFRYDRMNARENGKNGAHLRTWFNIFTLSPGCKYDHNY